MIRVAFFLALVAVAVGAPLSSVELDDFPPRPGCHYNISQQANFQLPNAAFHWYFDSITSREPIENITCLDWNGNFTRVNGNVGKTFFAEKVVEGGQTIVASCSGPNYADANADFATTCVFQRHNFKLQLRVSETDYKSYALLTFCGGPVGHNGQYVDFMGILGPKKSGVDPNVRQRIIKRLVKAGWNPDWIRRVPSQKDC